MYKINFQSCISRLLRYSILLLQHNRVVKPGKSLLVTVTNGKVGSAVEQLAKVCTCKIGFGTNCQAEFKALLCLKQYF